MKQKDCEWKIRARRLGAHIHCDVFVRDRGQVTWENTGHLVVDEDQWNSFRSNVPNVKYEEHP